MPPTPPPSTRYNSKAPTVTINLESNLDLHLHLSITEKMNGERVSISFTVQPQIFVGYECSGTLIFNSQRLPVVCCIVNTD